MIPGIGTVVPEAVHRNRAEPSIRDLTRLAADGLGGMFSEERQRFSFRAIRGAVGIRNKGISTRYTVISLLGLHRWEACGNRSPIDVRGAVDSLVDQPHGIEDIGDRGLLLWLCAMCSPDFLPRIWSAWGFPEAYPRHRGVREGRTMELSWFLSGLAHARLLPQWQMVRGLEELAERTSRHLFRNHHGRGIFRHSGWSSTAGILRGRFGSFADQVYPIHALSLYGRAFGSQMALDLALGCAIAIRNLQGPHGQWWWLYDAVTGRVVKRYPVYSVHQDGMAPMALSAVGNATGNNFRESIANGLRWIQGDNELGTTLVDPSRNVIWRCLKPGHRKAYLPDLWSFVKGAGNHEREDRDLRILYECRSYHLGWLLYALAEPGLS